MQHKSSLIAATALTLLVFLGVTQQRPAYAATFTVDTTSDANLSACTPSPNDCSLRGAITAANTASGADTIGFNIQPLGHVVIKPTSPLPMIVDPVNIDGTSQFGF